MKRKDKALYKLSCTVIALLCLLLVISALVGCTEQPEEPSVDTDVGDLTSTESPDDGVSVAGLSEYTVVRTELGMTAEKNAATELASLMRDSCGYAAIVTDYIDAVEKEILIGSTNRPESTAAMTWALSQVSEGESWFYIGATDNKIVLTGTGDDGVAAAVRYFIMNYKDQIKSGAVQLPEQAVFTYRNGAPTLVSTEMGTRGEKDVFVATIDLGSAPYFADADGESDVTKVIAKALEDVGAMGGGVVYLPAGTYRISDTLTLPQNVTLRGDYVDPDQGRFDAGTVLLIDGKKFQENKNVLIMNQGTLAQGLAVYYEGQSLSEPVAYAATVSCNAGQGCWELRDLTLINSYDGISNNKTPNGMVTVDNAKGTVLHMGYEMQQRADISIGTDIYLSPKYWAAAGEAYNAPDEADIRAYMKGNGSIGFYLGDCDRDTYENILLDGFATGMYNREMTRAGLSGSYYKVRILDTKVGIEGHGIDTRYGLLLANCEIEASDVAVNNATESDSAFCCVFLMNSTVKGELVGSVKQLTSEEGADDTVYRAKSRIAPEPAEKLFDLADYGADATGKTDVSAALQKALDDAAAAGGGIVYLRAGRYLLTQPVSIKGNNVQLLGCNLGTHTQNGALDTASILMVTYGRGGSEQDSAAITISGDNSGVTGFSVIYPENGVSSAEYETKAPAEYAYCIRATGKNTYVNFMCMIAVSRAVHFDGADDFICDRLLMTVWDNGVKANDCDGVISRIHTNGTYHTLGTGCLPVLGNDWTYNGAEVVVKILDTHIVNRLTLIRLENCSSVQLLHVFHYGARQYMDASNSDIYVLNGESSRLTGISFALHGNCDLTVINFMRPNPSEYLSQEGENYVYIYNWGAAHYSGERIVVLEP
ncbi:MAG: hypothetical protein IJW40_05590 [Clostridia bacterium]|nr:hypothetical protein [Clostridia bacterium]